MLRIWGQKISSNFGDISWRVRRLQDSECNSKWIQGELFSRTEIESVSKFWFWTIRNWGVQKCHIFFKDIKNLFVFCPWICYRLLFILNRFATFYNKLTKINGNLYFKNKRVQTLWIFTEVNTEAETKYLKTLGLFEKVQLDIIMFKKEFN